MTTATAPPSAPSAAAMRFDGTTGHCPQCQRVTATGLLRLSSGHIGRVCADCRAMRKGHPYARAFDWEQAYLNPPPPMPARAEGFHATAPR